MALTIEEIGVLASEAERLLSGRRVGKVYCLEPHRVFLSFRAGGKDVFLFLSTEPEVARFHLLWERPVFPERPSPFCMKLRAELSGKVFAHARPIERNRAVWFTFKDSETALAGEFFGRRGNVVLLARDRVVESLWPLGLGRARGKAYSLPPAPPGAGARQHPRYLPDAGGGDYPFSAAFARVMAAREQEVAFERAREAQLAQVRAARKRAERLCAHLTDDLREVAKADEYRRMGEALKCRLHEAARGLRALSAPDPERAGETLVITLDPARSARENLAHLFKKYRKLSDARAHVAARYEESAAALEALARDEETLGRLAWNAPGARETLDGIAGRRGAPRARRAKGPAATPARGPRRFTVRGHLVWVGRNAAENTELVRRIARGNDVFMHVAGKPGAVVILRAPPGMDAAPEAIGDAALLAVYYSLGKDAGAQDVDYTRVKHVRLLGARQGRFALADRRTLRATPSEDRLQAILESAGADRGKVR